ncbi:hypothetical protein FsymDg_2920 [Candidatus Protofrankia datiscae]|uniref:Uncharacterized protein n=1 Tax=Candidatus Protofrankia datiscae TaxID=2716812 RepID=F8B6N4_9ACTN|nr:hypothetical protein FsymDg_2920 [Candidatus Protofrankia datiscae]
MPRRGFALPSARALSRNQSSGKILVNEVAIVELASSSPEAAGGDLFRCLPQQPGGQFSDTARSRSRLGNQHHRNSRENRGGTGTGRIPGPGDSAPGSMTGGALGTVVAAGWAEDTLRPDRKDGSPR